MKDTIVLYAALGRGHLFSMVELGKLILTHNPSFSITILIPTPPNTPTTNLDNMYTTFGCNSSINFHHLPLPSSTTTTTTLPPHLLIFELTRHNNHNLHHALQSISKTSNLKAIVLDFLNYTATEVTTNLDIPTYFYYTSGASSLCVLLYSLNIEEDRPTELQIPGFPLISSKELPKHSGDLHRIFLDISSTMNDNELCDGIIVNTFDAIEDKGVKALQEGTCFRQKGGVTSPPPVFCIGPVISVPSGENDESGCMSWLDSQPSKSVVLLSFGSLGRFSKAQLKEIAIGLEASEQRFLWVVRSDESENGKSLEELLPEGFLERNKEKGKVVRDWAPQAEILSHDSVGGFVTHCGWNSVLEAVCEGVPMVAWPLYAEQKLNRAVMVKEMKVALGLEEGEDGFVSGTELGDRVKELMDSEKGKEIRQRVFDMKKRAVEARREGGSSYVALHRLTQLWKKKDHLSVLSPNTPLLYNY